MAFLSRHDQASHHWEGKVGKAKEGKFKSFMVLHTLKIRWTDGRVDGSINEWMDRWMDRWEGGWVNKWMDGQMGGRVGQ